MGFFSSISSLFSSAISTISAAVGSLGGALAGAASVFLKVAAPYLEVAIMAIQVVGVLLDVLKSDDNVEELGAKAMESDKKPEDFSSNAEYIDHLRNEVKLDQEKFEKATDVEKVARTAIGATIVAKGIEEKKGFDIPLSTWVAMAKLNLQDKPQEMNTILNTFKDGKLEDFVGYTEGKLDSTKELDIGDTLVDMYKDLEPNANIEDIEKKVMDMGN